MTHHTPRRIALATAALAVAVTPIAAQSALAQYGGSPPPDYGSDQAPPPPPPPQGYDRDAPPPPPPPRPGDYDEGGPPPPSPDYDQSQRYDAPPPDVAAPPGYDGSAPPPPPPGYQASPGYNYNAMRVQDDRYARDAEAWARDYCVKSHSNVAGGAVVGGIIGALLGNGLSGWRHRGSNTAVGAVLGAGAGAAVASGTQGATSPGCPPGYVVRGGAPTYGYTSPGYYYAAPDWYRPWVFVGGAWTFRPYPYHDYYYRHYWGPRHGYGGGPRRWHRGY